MKWERLRAHCISPPFSLHILCNGFHCYLYVEITKQHWGHRVQTQLVLSLLRNPCRALPCPETARRPLCVNSRCWRRGHLSTVRKWDRLHAHGHVVLIKSQSSKRSRADSTSQGVSCDCCRSKKLFYMLLGDPDRKRVHLKRSHAPVWNWDAIFEIGCQKRMPTLNW